MLLGPQSFLDKSELPLVLDYLHSRSIMDFHSRVNLAIFRLSCCCGLRTVEIQGLELRDFNGQGQRPTIHVRAETTKHKNGKAIARYVPLWWDKGTLEDLQEWYNWRMENTRTMRSRRPFQPFVCGVTIRNWGKKVHRTQIAKKWDTVMKHSLGPERAKQLSIHKGRHTWFSWALAIGRNLKEVQLAGGHQSLSSTNVYTHLVESLLDDRNLPDVFGNGQNGHSASQQPHPGSQPISDPHEAQDQPQTPSQPSPCQTTPPVA